MPKGERQEATYFHVSGISAHYGYTPAEHAEVIGPLVDSLDLDGFVVMGQDWGGPIGLSVAADRSDRVRGAVLGNTWFWPVPTRAKMFSRLMSTGFMQRRILEKNFFVERIMPFAMSAKLTEPEFDHYRKAQPTPELRKGVAEFPRQLVRAESFLSKLERKVNERLAPKPTLLTWGMRDMGFPPRLYIPQMKTRLPAAEMVELVNSKHFIQEEAHWGHP